MSKTYRASAPSNIALIKYWGKAKDATQTPCNDSLSMTLDIARTCTTARLLPPAAQDHIAYQGEAQSLGSSRPAGSGPGKAEQHLARLRQMLGYSAPLAITTSNSFPADCGIASSASGLAALTIAALAAWTDSSSFEGLEQHGYSRSRIADFARLGSGSAGRSLYGGFVRWQATDNSIQQLWDQDHWDLADLIVVLDATPKTTSSSIGHHTADTSPLFLPRQAGLGQRTEAVCQALLTRDLQRLGDLIEDEALEMHAVMMSQTPPARYLLGRTSHFLGWLRNQRRLGHLPAWFTLDAGPNPHVLCAQGDASSVMARLQQELPGVRIIRDQVGSGPTLHLEQQDQPDCFQHQDLAPGRETRNHHPGAALRSGAHSQ